MHTIPRIRRLSEILPRAEYGTGPRRTTSKQKHACVALRDEAGNIIRWYGTTIDIEDRKRAEDALRQSEAYLAEAQRLSHTGCFGWNVASGEILWSEESYRIFEYDPTTRATIEMVLNRVH